MAKRKLSTQGLPSNSITKRNSEVKKVTTGKIVTREKPFLARFFGDSMSSIGQYILWDVLIPAAKNTLSEIVSNGIEMLLYGDARPSSGIRRDRSRSYVSYNSIYDRGQRRTTTRARSRHSFDDVVLESRPDAEEVLSSLVELIDTYDVATVADFYSSVGLEGEWSDNKFGWDNLSSAEVKRIREGYILVLPKPVALD
jgi:hypothetical protein